MILHLKNKNFDKIELPEYTDNYHVLSPNINDVDDSASCYIDTLLWALDREEVRNIGITGLYGSGKSTILSKLIQDDKNHKYITVSLTDIKRNKSKKSDDDLSDDPEQHEVKIGILEQIIYQVRDEEIPFSRFKRVPSLTFKSMCVYMTMCVIAVTLLKIFFNPSVIGHTLRHFTELQIQGVPYAMQIILGVIGIILVMDLFYKGIWLLVRKIRGLGVSVGIKGSTFELGNYNSGTDIFDKYLDEIVYIFRNNESDVVVFEDLDRLDNAKIFVELRNLNQILNKDSGVSDKKRIVFIYAIKDQLFENPLERTKYFDFIVPVIPTITSFNAYEKLRPLIIRMLGENVLSDRFLEDVASQIKDMRTLYSIVNEFNLYYMIHSDQQMDVEKLFSLMVYKNVSPNEYALLQEGNGIIAKAIRDKEKLLENKIAEDQRQKEQIKFNLDRTNHTIENGNKELSILLWIELGLTTNGNDQIDSQNFDTFINNKRKFTEIKDIKKNGSTKSPNANQNEIIAAYERRREIAEYTIPADRERFVEQYREITRKISNIKAQTMAEILSNMDEQSEDLGAINLNMQSIEFFFLKNGYIDENYALYMSRFYGVKISKNDMAYVLSVRAGELLKRDYNIDSIEGVLDFMHSEDFSSIRFANYKIAEYLITDEIAGNIKEYKDKRHTAFTVLFDGSDESKEFLAELWRVSSDHKKIIHYLVKEWKDFWIWTTQEELFSKEELRILFKEMHQFAAPADILNLNGKDSIRNYAETIEDYCELLSDCPYETLETMMDSFQLRFSKLNDTKQSDILNHIYEKSMYEINENMVSILLQIYGDSTLEDITKSNYSEICANADNMECFAAYIEENIGKYVENVLMKMDMNTEENADCIIKLLQNDDIDDSVKIAIVTKEFASYESISSLPVVVWDDIINQDKLHFSMENVYYYYENKNEFTDSLIHYLELNIENISYDHKKANTWRNIFKMAGDSNASEMLYTKMFHLLCDACVKIDASYYVLNSCKMDKLEILLEGGILPFNRDTFNILKKRSGERHLHIRFLEVNAESYEPHINEYPVDSDDFNYLIRSDIKPSIKNTLATKFAGDVTRPQIISEMIDFIKSNISTLSISNVVIENVISDESVSDYDKVEILSTYFGKINASATTKKMWLQKAGSIFGQMLLEDVKTSYDENIHNFLKVIASDELIKSVRKQGDCLIIRHRLEEK